VSDGLEVLCSRFGHLEIVPIIIEFLAVRTGLVVFHTAPVYSKSEEPKGFA
jgi:hypothetical protein